MPQVVFLSKGQGIKTTDYRLQTTGDGQWATDNGRRTMDDRQWTTDNGHRWFAGYILNSLKGLLSVVRCPFLPKL